MRTLFIYFLLATSSLAAGQSMDMKVVLNNMWQSSLEGEFQIRHASARPAARSYFLLYAAALDEYAIKNKEVLQSHTPLATLVEDAKLNAVRSFDEYNITIARGFAPIVNSKQELADLERFVASGYSGNLKQKLLMQIDALKK